MNISNVQDAHFLEPFAIVYTSGEYALKGYLLLPEGEGPFPAVIFEHGSSGLLPSNLPGIEVLQGMGYAVFVAIRRGHNGNPGPAWLSFITSPWGSEEMGMQLMRAFEGETADVLAALNWLQRRPEIDAQRIGIVGSSFGAVVAILAAGQTSHFKAGVSFAGPSQSWPDVPALQKAMLSAIQQSCMPFFLIQAQNDHSLMPTYVLGMELARLEKPHETRIYPALGSTPMEGHGIFGRAVEWWQKDVERFLAQWLSE